MQNNYEIQTKTCMALEKKKIVNLHQCTDCQGGTNKKFSLEKLKAYI